MKKIWDKWGVALSGACLLHCALVVLSPLILPALQMTLHSPWIHRLFALIILFVTPLAFIPIYRKHGIQKTMFLATMGIILVLAGLFTDGYVAEWLSHTLSLVGSICLIIAHAFNLRQSHRHRNCC